MFITLAMSYPKNSTLRSTFSVLAIVIPIIFGIFKALLKIKNSSEKYANFFVPFLIVVFWLLFYLPVGCFLPYMFITKENTG